MSAGLISAGLITGTARAYWEAHPAIAYERPPQSLATTRSGLNVTRRALKALRASPLGDLGWRLALRQLAEAAAERGPLALELELPARLPALAPAVEQCLYRIAQEALENVVRHAEARTLCVRLAASGTGLELLVQDDGRGGDLLQPAPAGHMGLAGMRERAELAGGRLDIQCRPGHGTTIRLIS